MSWKNFYESKTVKKTQVSQSCDCCGKTIKSGSPSEVYVFNCGEWYDTRIHPKCSDRYEKGDWCTKCGEWTPDIREKTPRMCMECIEKELKKKIV